MRITGDDALIFFSPFIVLIIVIVVIVVVLHIELVVTYSVTQAIICEVNKTRGENDFCGYLFKGWKERSTLGRITMNSSGTVQGHSLHC